MCNGKPVVGQQMLAVRLGWRETTYHRADVMYVGRKYFDVHIHGYHHVRIEMAHIVENGLYWPHTDYHIYASQELFHTSMRKHKLREVIRTKLLTASWSSLWAIAKLLNVDIPVADKIEVIDYTNAP